MDDPDRGANIARVRLSARVFTVIFVVFVVLLWLMMIAEGRQSPSLEPMKPLAAVWFGMLGLYAVAMSLALIPRCERVAVLVGVAVLLGAHVEGLFLALFEYPGHLTLVGVVNPLVLPLWVPVLLYLLCWRLEGRKLFVNAPKRSLPDTV